MANHPSVSSPTARVLVKLRRSTPCGRRSRGPTCGRCTTSRRPRPSASTPLRSGSSPRCPSRPRALGPRARPGRGQLGVSESDVIFAEPDLVHTRLSGRERGRRRPGRSRSARTAARSRRTATHGKALGPDAFAWHLGDATRSSARRATRSSSREPRTRIGAPRHRLLPRARDRAGAHRSRRSSATSSTATAIPAAPRDPDNRRLLRRQLRPRHRHARHPGGRQGLRPSAARCSAARPTPKSCRCASPTASCCCAPARSRGRSATPSSSAATSSP